MHSVDAICEEMHQLLVDMGNAELVFVCDLIFREMLLNAVHHGCDDVSANNFTCKISISHEEAQFTIKDYGNGFKHELWRSPSCASDKESGRGLMIINRYSDRYRFNASGNCLSVKKRVTV